MLVGYAVKAQSIAGTFYDVGTSTKLVLPKFMLRVGKGLVRIFSKQV